MEECTLLFLIATDSYSTFHPEQFVYLFVIRYAYMYMCVSTQNHRNKERFGLEGTL